MAAPTCTTDEAMLVFHCAGTGCTWWTCPECEAVYDVDRGVRRLRDGSVESWAADG